MAPIRTVSPAATSIAVQGRLSAAPGDVERPGDHVGNAVGRVLHAVRARGEHREVGDGPEARPSVDSVAEREPAHAFADLVDDARHIGAEPRRKRDSEELRSLRERRHLPVEWVQPRRGDTHADLALAGVRLGHLVYLEHLRSAEFPQI